MKDNDWIELVRLIPEDQQNKLVLTTMTGIDLNVEIILRLEENYLVFRGRISGITDEGRVFFLPYRQIDYMQLNRRVKEAEIHEMYGEEPPAEAVMPTSGVFAAPSGVFNAVTAADSRRESRPARPHRRPRPKLPVGHRCPASAGPIVRRARHWPWIESRSTAASDTPTPPRNSILERLRPNGTHGPVAKPPRR